jgi:hypothetical protein
MLPSTGRAGRPWTAFDRREGRAMVSGSPSTLRTFVPSDAFQLEKRTVMATGVQSAPAISLAAHIEKLRDEPTDAAVAPTVNRWSWLANTYWMVPVRNLPAMLYDSDTGQSAPVSDQTVYHIAGYREGYYWGTCVTQIGSLQASNTSLIGSVTPQGRILLNFTATSSNSSPTITQGIGQMRRKSGQWTMENQMFTSPSETLQIGHWAYMVQTRPGMPSWYSLPPAGESVPEFMSQ